MLVLIIPLYRPFKGKVFHFEFRTVLGMRKKTYAEYASGAPARAVLRYHAAYATDAHAPTGMPAGIGPLAV